MSDDYNSAAIERMREQLDEIRELLAKSLTVYPGDEAISLIDKITEILND